MRDPDKLLQEIRDTVLAWEKADTASRTEWEAAEKVTGLISALDDWLIHGGTLPRDWALSEPMPTAPHRPAALPRRKIFRRW